MSDSILVALGEQLTAQRDVGRTTTPAFGSSSMQRLIYDCTQDLKEEDFHRILDAHEDRPGTGELAYLIDTVEHQILEVMAKHVGHEHVAEQIVAPGRAIVATLMDIRTQMESLREEQLSAGPGRSSI